MNNNKHRHGELPGTPNPPEALSGKSIAVIGGGVLGMFLAWQLRERGAEVTVLERAPAAGGLASPSTIGPYTWDRFYHVILLSDQHLLEMLERLDLDAELSWGITKTGFYTDGNLYSMSNSIEFLRFPPLNFVDKLRLGATIFLASKIRDWRSLERVLATDWLRKWSGSRVLERIWLPLLKSKLGDNYRIASAAFIWAIIARMYAARRAGLKQEMFGYVRGGYSSVLERLQDKLDEIGVRTVYSTQVDELSSEQDGVQLRYGGGESEYFDSAVLTVPTNTISKLCPQLSNSEVSRLEQVTYQGIICPSFVLKRGLSPYYVTNITDSGIPFTGVIEMTALVDSSNFGGNALVYLPQYLTQSSDYWQKNDEEIYEDCIAALLKMYPDFQRDHIVSRNIARARDVLAVSTLGYSDELRPEVQTSLANVFIMNSAQIANGTLNVNETIGVVKQNLPELQEAILAGAGQRK